MFCPTRDMPLDWYFVFDVPVDHSTKPRPRCVQHVAGHRQAFVSKDVERISFRLIFFTMRRQFQIEVVLLHMPNLVHVNEQAVQIAERRHIECAMLPMRAAG